MNRSGIRSFALPGSVYWHTAQVGFDGSICYYARGFAYWWVPSSKEDRYWIFTVKGW